MTLEVLTRRSIEDHTPLEMQNVRFTVDLNERITEDIVRDIFKANRAKQSPPQVTIYEQIPDNPRIKKLLKFASKQGQGTGKPEFIVTFNQIPDLLLVVECKADQKKHGSINRDNPRDYAVDGVLLYSEYLAKEFDVIALAVSGQNEVTLKVSTFLQLKQQPPVEKPDKKIMSFMDYVNLYRKDPEKEKTNVSNLLKYSKKLHNDLRDYAKLSEPEKPLLVSAILIALTDDSFVSSYSKKKTSKSLAKLLLSTVKELLEAAELPQKKIETMLYPYKFIEVHPELTKEKDKDGKPVTLLYDLIKDIEENTRSFVRDHQHFDILGQFYGEFLRYTGGDKKGLGIVLTPKHITELFVDLAKVNKDDVVLDNCCGTGGFLISAMKQMISDAGNDEEKIKKIKETQLIGIEPQSNMFALTCANMILRRDGKANIYQDSCFNIIDTIRVRHKCTVGFLNPPYSQKGEGLHELDFVSNCLDGLEKNGVCIAIVPISCATAPSIQKENLLKNHTLEAVMSMPIELFDKAGAVTCIVVFRAKVPHDSKKKTWFGYWRNDGFVKTKHEGRIDKNNQWEQIRQEWLDHFYNKKEIAGKCVLHSVNATDEWVAEAYMNTDYSQVTKEDFLNSLKEYVIFKIRNVNFG